jgi:hypothetical protein
MEAEIREDCGLRLAWAKSYLDPISTNKKLSIAVCACHQSYVGSINRRTVI